MDVENLPLLELFTHLREAELPLGIDEYELLLSALQAGFGISNRVSLKNLCRTLWVKSADDDRLFDYHFEQLVTQPSENESFSQALESLPELPEMSTDTSLPLPTLETDMPKTPLTTPTEGTGTSEMTIGAEDEVRVAQAVLQTASTLRLRNIHDRIEGGKVKEKKPCRNELLGSCSARKSRKTSRRSSGVIEVSSKWYCERASC